MVVNARTQRALAKMANCHFNFIGCSPRAERYFGFRKFLPDDWLDDQLAEHVARVAERFRFGLN